MVDQEYLQSVFDKIEQNIITWRGYFETIKQTYNYRGNTSNNTIVDDNSNTNAKYNDYEDEK
jgi:hypothetical protein